MQVYSEGLGSLLILTIADSYLRGPLLSPVEKWTEAQCASAKPPILLNAMLSSQGGSLQKTARLTILFICEVLENKASLRENGI
jgi:hypothetical protein